MNTDKGVAADISIQKSDIASSIAPRIAILGAGGIGRLHARIFHNLGAQITAVLSASEETSKRHAKELTKELGCDVVPYWELEMLLNEPLDGVSICTPTELHFDNMIAALDNGIPVFCEKPLCWNKDWDRRKFDKNLDVLRKHPSRGVFVNTSNASFITQCIDQLPASGVVDDFKFQFFTQGNFRRCDIAIDLMPHGLSLLLAYFGEKAVANFRSEVYENNYLCNFKYGDVEIEFDFRQNPLEPKHFGFSCDGIQFIREQRDSGSNYKVSLKNLKSGISTLVEDPFILYIRNFLQFCQSGGCDDFEEAETIQRLMGQCLGFRA